MSKYLINVKTNFGMLVDSVCDDINIAHQILSDLILEFFESQFKNILTDDNQNYYAFELNEYLNNGDYPGLIKFANNIPALYRPHDEVFSIDIIPHYITMQSIIPIKNVSVSRALQYKNVNNLFNNVHVFTSAQNNVQNTLPQNTVSCSGGATCRHCNQYNEYVLPDATDGKMTCTSCKLWNSIV